MGPSPATEARLAELVELACRAPSVHNSQPWLWLVDGDSVTLFADRRRHLAHTDPDGRDLLLSCGAALHHLKVAAAAAGWEAEIRRLPNPANDAQLATVTFSARPPGAGAARAAELLRRRRTDRRSTAGTPVDRDHLDALMDQVRPFGVVAFAVVSARARTMLLGLLAEADAVQRRDPDYLREITEWVDRNGGDGVPTTNLVRHAPAAGDLGAGTRFPPGLLPEPPTGRLHHGSDPLLVLCTSGDDAASWLRAGEALSAVLLEAEARGLSAVPLSQATEVDQVREVLQGELLKDAACPQILVHVGRPSQGGQPVPPTPRRPVAEVMCDVADLPDHVGPYTR